MNKEVLKNLLTMMQSYDKDDNYMAMQAIVNLGNSQTVQIEYKEELLFLWLYSKSHIDDWSIVKPEVAKMFLNLLEKHRPKGSLTLYKQDLKFKERWLYHLIDENSHIKKPWIAELMIEEFINEKKRIFKALDFKFKEIQIKIVQ